MKQMSLHCTPPRIRAAFLHTGRGGNWILETVVSACSCLLLLALACSCLWRSLPGVRLVRPMALRAGIGGLDWDLYDPVCKKATTNDQQVQHPVCPLSSVPDYTSPPKPTSPPAQNPPQRGADLQLTDTEQDLPSLVPLRGAVPLPPPKPSGVCICIPWVLGAGAAEVPVGLLRIAGLFS
jgi:hypothetical protein